MTVFSLSQAWGIIRECFGIVPFLFGSFFEIARRIPLAGVIFAAALAAGLYVSFRRKPAGQECVNLSLTAGFVLTVAFMICQRVIRYPYGGLFAVIGDGIAWYVPISLFCALWLSAARIWQWFKRADARDIVRTCLLLPGCVGVAVVTALYIGIPLFRFLTGLIMKDFYRENMAPVCVRAAVYAGLLVYGNSVGEKKGKKKGAEMLLWVLAAAVAACFYPLGIAMVIVVGGILLVIDRIGGGLEKASPSEKVRFAGSSIYLTDDEKIQLEDRVRSGSMSRDELEDLKERILEKGSMTETDEVILRAKEENYL